jgi:hypothetical protein
MEQSKLIDLIQNYDFIKNTKISFARKYNISIRTVDRYVSKLNIKYNKKNNNIKLNRDNFGKFTLNTKTYINPFPPGNKNPPSKNPTCKLNSRAFNNSTSFTFHFVTILREYLKPNR